MIKLSGISKNYGDHQILQNFNIEVGNNEFLTIIGKSGCGKSTLLNIMGLLESPSTGSVIVDGQNVKNIESKVADKMRREKIGYVFQNFALIENDTVDKNLKLAMKYNKTIKNKKEAKVQALRKVGLDDSFLNKKVVQLSGGEQQRVAIARILLKPFEVILADEPTGSLDQENETMVMDIFQELKNAGKSIIMVTHNKELAKKGDRMIDLS